MEVIKAGNSEKNAVKNGALKVLSWLSFVFHLHTFFSLSYAHLDVGHTDVAYSTTQEIHITLLHIGFTPASSIYVVFYIYG